MIERVTHISDPNRCKQHTHQHSERYNNMTLAQKLDWLQKHKRLIESRAGDCDLLDCVNYDIAGIEQQIILEQNGQR